MRRSPHWWPATRGSAAVQRWNGASEAIPRSSSPTRQRTPSSSPSAAEGIAAFLADGAGKRWMDARVDAFAAASADYHGFAAAAQARGLAAPDPNVDQEDLLLPRALHTDPLPGSRQGR